MPLPWLRFHLGVLLGRFIRFSNSSLWLSLIAYSMTFSAVLIADLIVLALKQVDEDINGLGDVGLYPGNSTEGFVVGLLKCCS